MLVALALFGIVALAFFVIRQLSRYAIPDAPGVLLNDMRSIEDKRQRFNQDPVVPRLILLLSPT